MWMCYAAESWPTPVDLESTIQRVSCELSACSFDADHESVYNLNYCFDEEEVQRLQELSEKYSEGAEVCDLYLSGEISLECLYYEFLKLNLKSYLYCLKRFAPEELHNRFCKKEPDHQNG